MDELFAALIAALFDILGEVIIQVGLEFLASLLVRAGRKAISTPLRQDRLFTGFLFAAFGAVMGIASAVIFPHPLIHPSRFHGISLLISPVITGLVMLGTGRLVQKLGRKPTPIETFWIGFIFALAMAAVRFVLVS
jgi:hypothetical protein